MIERERIEDRDVFPFVGVRSHVTSQGELSPNPILGTDLAGLVSVAVMDACSLDAEQIRTRIFTTFEDGIEGTDYIRVQSERIKDLSFEFGEKVQTVERDRLVQRLAVQNGNALYAWVETPKDGLFGRDKDHDLEDLPEQQLFFGLGKSSKFGDEQLFVPLLKSDIVNGCQFVIPQNSETDQIAFNNSGILKMLQYIVAEKTSLRHDGSEVDRLLVGIHDALTTSEHGAALQLFISEQLHSLPPELHVVKSLLSGELDSYRRVERKLTQHDGEHRVFQIVGDVYETQEEVNGELRQLEFFLEDRGIAEANNGLKQREFMLWGGLDPDIYRRSGMVFPQFTLRKTEFGAINIMFHPNGSRSNETTPTQEQLDELLTILNAKMSRSRDRGRTSRPSRRIDTRMPIEDIVRRVLEDRQADSRHRPFYNEGDIKSFPERPIHSYSILGTKMFKK